MRCFAETVNRGQVRGRSLAPARRSCAAFRKAKSAGCAPRRSASALGHKVCRCRGPCVVCSPSSPFAGSRPCRCVPWRPLGPSPDRRAERCAVAVARSRSSTVGADVAPPVSSRAALRPPAATWSRPDPPFRVRGRCVLRCRASASKAFPCTGQRGFLRFSGARQEPSPLSAQRFLAPISNFRWPVSINLARMLLPNVEPVNGPVELCTALSPQIRHVTFGLVSRRMQPHCRHKAGSGTGA